MISVTRADLPAHRALTWLRSPAGARSRRIRGRERALCSSNATSTIPWPSPVPASGSCATAVVANTPETAAPAPGFVSDTVGGASAGSPANGRFAGRLLTDLVVGSIGRVWVLRTLGARREA